MRERLQKLGRVRLVVVITFVAVILAVSANLLITELFWFQTTWFEDVLRASLIPIFLAPLLSWYLVGMFFKLDSLEKEMSMLAKIDGLTLIPNRRYFYQQSSAWLANDSNRGKAYAFFILDMDFFKDINDRYGHLCGDKVLEQFGVLLKNVAPSPNIVGRLGGEEFAVFLPDMDQKEAECVADQICQSMRESMIEQDGEKVTCSVSIGISINKNSERNVIEDAFKYADLALYEAKKSGRDCYCVYLSAEKLLVS